MHPLKFPAPGHTAETAMAEDKSSNGNGKSTTLEISKTRLVFGGATLVALLSACSFVTLQWSYLQQERTGTTQQTKINEDHERRLRELEEGQRDLKFTTDSIKGDTAALRGEIGSLNRAVIGYTVGTNNEMAAFREVLAEKGIRLPPSQRLQPRPDN